MKHEVMKTTDGDATVTLSSENDVYTVELDTQQSDAHPIFSKQHTERLEAFRHYLYVISCELACRGNDFDEQQAIETLVKTRITY